MRAIVRAYYHKSECTYAFGPFNEKQLKRFMENDKNLDKDGQPKHEDWMVIWFNRPDQYGTGYERSDW